MAKIKIADKQVTTQRKYNNEVLYEFLNYIKNCLKNSGKFKTEDIRQKNSDSISIKTELNEALKRFISTLSVNDLENFRDNVRCNFQRKILKNDKAWENAILVFKKIRIDLINERNECKKLLENENNTEYQIEGYKKLIGEITQTLISLDSDELDILNDNSKRIADYKICDDMAMLLIQEEIESRVITKESIKH